MKKYLFLLFVINLSNCTSLIEEEGSVEIGLPMQIRKYIPPGYESNIRAEDVLLLENLILGNKEDLLTSRASEIILPAGGTNKLSEAISNAGPHETIVLEPGDHFQTVPITISKTVHIVGHAANLIFSNVKGVASPAPATFVYTPGIHIKPGADLTSVRGINFKSTDPLPGVCIFIDHVSSAKILKNTFENWQFSIAGYEASYAIIAQNKITCNGTWVTGAIPESDGIILSDGAHNSIVDNEISLGVFGIFTGGSQGLSWGNKTESCLYGQILCKVPSGFLLVGGTQILTASSTSNWLVLFNQSNNNFAAGYLVIDGAQRNFMEHNQAKNNAAYDIELTGDSERFGFFTPRSFNNSVIAYNKLKIKDCGEGNKVYGGDLVNNSIDPCN